MDIFLTISIMNTDIDCDTDLNTNDINTFFVIFNHAVSITVYVELIMISNTDINIDTNIDYQYQ